MLLICGTGIKFEDLEAEMCKIYSDADQEVIENFLWGLLENGFLISELRLPKANINEIDYLIEIVGKTKLEEGLLTDLLEIQKFLTLKLFDLKQMYQNLYHQMNFFPEEIIEPAPAEESHTEID